MFQKSAREIADLIKKREVRKIVYFHCDHFEPWRDSKGGVSLLNAEDVLDFCDTTSKIDFARKLTLFYKCNNYVTVTPSENAVFSEGDSIGFVRPTPDKIEIAGTAMAHVAHCSDHELQLHYHHEFFTTNLKYCLIPEETREFFLSGRNSPALDRARWRVGIRLALETIRKEAKIPMDEWFFVHGMWSLNASDPDVCSITNEIELLLAEGCRGDFSFPAGRPHCDAKYPTPVYVVPTDSPKGYDAPEAAAQAAFGNSRAYEAKNKGKVDLKKMHDEMLSFGSPAAKYVKEMMDLN